MKKTIVSILCLIMVISGGYIPHTKASEVLNYEIYVSPYGTDSGTGSIDSPFKSLERAKVAAVEMAKTAKSDVTVFLRGGSYNPGAGLMFSGTDSGTDDSIIRFKAYNGEKVSVSNAVVLDNTKFSIVTDEKVLSRIPAEARGKIYSINLPANGINNLGEIRRAGMSSEYHESPDSRMLIINESRFTLARWPNGDYANINKVINASNTKAHKFSYSESKGNRWDTATEAWVHGFFRYLWADDTLPISEIDCVEKTIWTKGAHVYGIKEENPYFIFNLLEELDIPGEWFLDSATGVLYVYPKSDISKAQVKFAPNTEDLITMTGAKNISFEDIIFEDTCGIAVRMKDCENVVFDNCEFRNIGQRAVSIDSGYDCGVKNSYVHDTGKGGIYMEGGDDVNFTPSNNFVDNCHIERFGLSALTYSSAVKLYGVGNRMSHCLINDGTHLAVQYNGIDNVAEYNEIYNVLKHSHDAGVFYGGRTWTSKVTLRNNYIHGCGNMDLLSDDVWMTQAIYADDGMVGLHIYNNIIDNLFGGISLHYGRHSYIKNNYILNTQRGVRLNCYNGDTDMEDLGKRNENVKNLFLEQGIEGVKGVIEGALYNSYVNAKNKNWDLYIERFPWLDTICTDELLFPKYNEMSGNIFVNSGEYDWHFLPEEGNTRENNYVTDKFTSYEELASHVPGFEPIDINEIGLREKENKPVGNFRALGPANGATEVSSEYVSLVWEPSEGASNYELVVAEDSEFKNIVLHENLTDTYILMPKLKSGGQKYYWKVSATSVSDNYTDVAVPNSNGVQSFCTAITENETELGIPESSYILNRDFTNGIDEADRGKMNLNCGSDDGLVYSHYSTSLRHAEDESSLKVRVKYAGYGGSTHLSGLLFGAEGGLNSNDQFSSSLDLKGSIILEADMKFDTVMDTEYYPLAIVPDTYMQGPRNWNFTDNMIRITDGVCYINNQEVGSIKTNTYYKFKIQLHIDGDDLTKDSFYAEVSDGENVFSGAGYVGSVRKTDRNESNLTGVGFINVLRVNPPTTATDDDTAINIYIEKLKFYYPDAPVVNSSIADGAIGIKGASSISLTFDREMNTDTFGDITLEDSSGNAIKSLRVLAADSRTCIVTLPEKLKNSYGYRLLIPVSVLSADGTGTAARTISFVSERNNIVQYYDFTDAISDTNIANINKSSVGFDGLVVNNSSTAYVSPEDNSINLKMRAVKSGMEHMQSCLYYGAGALDGSGGKFTKFLELKGNIVLESEMKFDTVENTKYYPLAVVPDTATNGSYVYNYVSSMIKIINGRCYINNVDVGEIKENTYYKLRLLLNVDGEPTTTDTFIAEVISEDVKYSGNGKIESLTSGASCSQMKSIAYINVLRALPQGDGEEPHLDDEYVNADIKTLNFYIVDEESPTNYITADVTCGTIAAGSDVNVKAVFTNESNSALTPCFIVALYRGDGQLVDAAIVSNETLAAKGIYTLDKTFKVPSDIDSNAYIKIFAWNGITSLVPLMEVIEK